MGRGAGNQVVDQVVDPLSDRDARPRFAPEHEEISTRIQIQFQDPDATHGTSADSGWCGSALVPVG